MTLDHSAPLDRDSDPQAFLASLPALAAVFVLVPNHARHPNAQPYISRTRDLRRRLTRLLGRPRPGSKLLNLREVAGEVQYQRVGSSFEAQWLVYELSRVYDPEHYRDRLRLRPPALLKINLRNRFPRCYVTRRLASDGSLYYGPFPSRAEAERFASAFLDLFKVRRCVEDLHPDPTHPGCIYSQMKMCLAPCFGGCTDEQYQGELGRVISFLDTDGRSLAGALEAERTSASGALAFEEAARIHKKIEQAQEVLRLRPGLARNLQQLHAVLILPAAEPASVLFFRLTAGELSGPAVLSLDERVATPVPLDEQLHSVLDSLLLGSPGAAPRQGSERLPPWEHLSLVARCYYGSFREGELVMLAKNQEIPHARVIRACRKLLRSRL